jgi:two-component system chemotaxis sensor kinase CheA
MEDRALEDLLRAIEQQATSAGCLETAATAAGLLSTLPDAARRSAFADWLSSGVLRLQQALDAERNPAPPSSLPQSAPLSLTQDPDLVADFIVEARDHLSAVEAQMLAIEQDPQNLEPLYSAFRGFHTVKGLAGFLEFSIIQEVAHEIETVLDLARNAQIAVTPEVVDVILAGADFLRLAIEDIEQAFQGRATSTVREHRSLIERIRLLLRAGPSPRVPRVANTRQDSAVEAPPFRGSVQAVKVDTAKLDHLVDMVGEMVIAQSLLRHDPDLAELRSTRLQRTISQLSRITTDVQHTAMSMRMVPVNSLFRRLSRLVRDLSRKAGKLVDFEAAGEDTELDRNIVEELADPLMHMVRNAIDHGLETPDERTRSGKEAHGRISLKAYHQSGLIVIELSDDGRGLDRERILAKAREKGLVEGGNQLSDSEVFAFIFEPGFSTAARVTEVSGRGVGMDVVKRNINKLRGRVDIRSAKGKGATFTITLPLTLAIIDALVVAVGRERYLLPISIVHEMLRPGAETVFTIENRAEMVMVRGSLLPMVRLHKRFNVGPRSEDPCQSLLIVTEARGRRFCLMVDELVGKQEVVIKSLGEVFKNIRGVAGGAILGDGRVGLILDVDGIFGGTMDV